MPGAPPRWVGELFAPILGVLICNVMWLSPMNGVLEARRKRDLGSLNPIPFAVTVCNCVGWVIYGCMRRDYYIFWANSPGLVLGCFYSLSSLVLLNRKRSDVMRYNIMTAILIFSASFWCFMAMIACIVFDDSAQSKEQGIVFIGTLGMAFGLCYYISPLSSMLQVIRKRDSSSLSTPLIATSFCNALLWVVYGYLAKGDIAIWLPNAVGVALCTFQLIMKVVLPSKLPMAAAVAADELTQDDSVKLEISLAGGDGMSGATGTVESPLHASPNGYFMGLSPYEEEEGPEVAGGRDGELYAKC